MRTKVQFSMYIRASAKNATFAPWIDSEILLLSDYIDSGVDELEPHIRAYMYKYVSIFRALHSFD